MAIRVAIVDDDMNIRELVEAYLQKEGYKTIGLGSAEEALELSLTSPPDLWVLDIMFPGMDGYELCRRIRMESDVPIIMISARDEEVNKIMGIELGSDDYMTKPFSPRELVVRVNRLLYRWKKWYEQHEGSVHFDVQKRLDRFSADPIIPGLEILEGERFVRWQGEEVELTEKEVLLLKHLAKRVNHACSREELLNEVWGHQYKVTDRTVDDVIKRLRKKMYGLVVETVWGYGYRLRSSGKE